MPVDDAVALRRARMIVQTSAGGWIGFFVGAFVQFLLGAYLISAVHAATAIILAAAPWVLRTTGSLRVSAYMLCYGSVAGIAGLQYTAWGPHGPSIAVWAIAILAASSVLPIRRFTSFTLVTGLVATTATVVDLVQNQSELPLATVLAYGIASVMSIAVGYALGLQIIRVYELESAQRMRKEQRFRLAADSAQVGVWEWLPPDTLRFASPDLPKTLGWAPVDSEAPTPDSVLRAALPDSEADRFREMIRKLIKGRKDVRAEFQLRGVNAGHWVEVTVTAEFGPDGKLDRVVGGVRDVTRSHLEQQRKSQFVATMSHELRSPLNSILGMSELMDDAYLPAVHKRRLRVIQDSGRHMLGTIDDVLDFARLEADALSLASTDVDIRRVVAATLSMFAPIAQKQELQLIGWTDPDVPDTITGDGGRLRQVLTNLIGNAVKFTRRGMIDVHVRREDRVLYLSVKDTGIGIPRAKQEKIFDPYEQVEPGTRQMGGGQGLGLAISRRLVRRMGGELQCESEINVGSTFTFHVPLADVDLVRVPKQHLRGLMVAVCGCGAPSSVIVAEALRQHGRCRHSWDRLASPVENSCRQRQSYPSIVIPSVIKTSREADAARLLFNPTRAT